MINGYGGNSGIPSDGNYKHSNPNSQPHNQFHDQGQPVPIPTGKQSMYSSVWHPSEDLYRYYEDLQNQRRDITKTANSGTAVRCREICCQPYMDPQRYPLNPPSSPSFRISSRPQYSMNIPNYLDSSYNKKEVPFENFIPQLSPPSSNLNPTYITNMNHKPVLKVPSSYATFSTRESSRIRPPPPYYMAAQDISKNYNPLYNTNSVSVPIRSNHHVDNRKHKWEACSYDGYSHQVPYPSSGTIPTSNQYNASHMFPQFSPGFSSQQASTVSGESYSMSMNIPDYDCSYNTPPTETNIQTETKKPPDKKLDIDVREYLATWDDDEDDIAVKAPEPTPLVVLDCTVLEEDGLAQVREKLKGRSVQVVPSNMNDSKLPYDMGNATIVQVQSTNLDLNDSSRTYQPLDFTKQVNSSSVKEPPRKTEFEALVSYYGDVKKNSECNYDLVEITERLVDATHKISPTSKTSISDSVTPVDATKSSPGLLIDKKRTAELMEDPEQFITPSIINKSDYCNKSVNLVSNEGFCNKSVPDENSRKSVSTGKFSHKPVINNEFPTKPTSPEAYCSKSITSQEYCKKPVSAEEYCNKPLSTVNSEVGTSQYFKKSKWYHSYQETQLTDARQFEDNHSSYASPNFFYDKRFQSSCSAVSIESSCLWSMNTTENKISHSKSSDLSFGANNFLTNKNQFSPESKFAKDYMAETNKILTQNVQISPIKGNPLMSTNVSYRQIVENGILKNAPVEDCNLMNEDKRTTICDGDYSICRNPITKFDKIKDENKNSFDPLLSSARRSSYNADELEASEKKNILDECGSNDSTGDYNDIGDDITKDDNLSLFCEGSFDEHSIHDLKNSPDIMSKPLEKPFKPNNELKNESVNIINPLQKVNKIFPLAGKSSVHRKFDKVMSSIEKLNANNSPVEKVDKTITPIEKSDKTISPIVKNEKIISSVIKLNKIIPPISSTGKVSHVNSLAEKNHTFISPMENIKKLKDVKKKISKDKIEIINKMRDYRKKKPISDVKVSTKETNEKIEERKPIKITVQKTKIQIKSKENQIKYKTQFKLKPTKDSTEDEYNSKKEPEKIKHIIKKRNDLASYSASSLEDKKLRAMKKIQESVREETTCEKLRKCKFKLLKQRPMMTIPSFSIQAKPKITECVENDGAKKNNISPIENEKCAPFNNKTSTNSNAITIVEENKESKVLNIELDEICDSSKLESSAATLVSIKSEIVSVSSSVCPSLLSENDSKLSTFPRTESLKISENTKRVSNIGFFESFPTLINDSTNSNQNIGLVSSKNEETNSLNIKETPIANELNLNKESDDNFQLVEENLRKLHEKNYSSEINLSSHLNSCSNIQKSSNIMTGENWTPKINIPERTDFKNVNSLFSNPTNSISEFNQRSEINRDFDSNHPSCVYSSSYFNQNSLNTYNSYHRKEDPISIRNNMSIDNHHSMNTDIPDVNQNIIPTETNNVNVHKKMNTNFVNNYDCFSNLLNQQESNFLGNSNNLTNIDHVNQFNKHDFQSEKFHLNEDKIIITTKSSDKIEIPAVFTSLSSDKIKTVDLSSDNLENVEPDKLENAEPDKLENVEPDKLENAEPNKLENAEPSTKIENKIAVLDKVENTIKVNEIHNDEIIVKDENLFPRVTSDLSKVQQEPDKVGSHDELKSVKESNCKNKKLRKFRNLKVRQNLNIEVDKNVIEKSNKKISKRSCLNLKSKILEIKRECLKSLESTNILSSINKSNCVSNINQKSSNTLQPKQESSNVSLTEPKKVSCNILPPSSPKLNQDSCCISSPKQNQDLCDVSSSKQNQDSCCISSPKQNQGPCNFSSPKQNQDLYNISSAIQKQGSYNVSSEIQNQKSCHVSSPKQNQDSCDNTSPKQNQDSCDVSSPKQNQDSCNISSPKENQNFCDVSSPTQKKDSCCISSPKQNQDSCNYSSTQNQDSCNISSPKENQDSCNVSFSTQIQDSCNVSSPKENQDLRNSSSPMQYQDSCSVPSEQIANIVSSRQNQSILNKDSSKQNHESSDFSTMGKKEGNTSLSIKNQKSYKNSHFDQNLDSHHSDTSNEIKTTIIPASLLEISDTIDNSHIKYTQKENNMDAPTELKTIKMDAKFTHVQNELILNDTKLNNNEIKSQNCFENFDGNDKASETYLDYFVSDHLETEDNYILICNDLRKENNIIVQPSNVEDLIPSGTNVQNINRDSHISKSVKFDNTFVKSKRTFPDSNRENEEKSSDPILSNCNNNISIISTKEKEKIDFIEINLNKTETSELYSHSSNEIYLKSVNNIETNSNPISENIFVRISTDSEVIEPYHEIENILGETNVEKTLIESNFDGNNTDLWEDKDGEKNRENILRNEVSIFNKKDKIDKDLPEASNEDLNIHVNNQTSNINEPPSKLSDTIEINELIIKETISTNLNILPLSIADISSTTYQNLPEDCITNKLESLKHYKTDDFTSENISPNNDKIDSEQPNIINIKAITKHNRTFNNEGNDKARENLNIKDINITNKVNTEMNLSENIIQETNTNQSISQINISENIITFGTVPKEHNEIESDLYFRAEDTLNIDQIDNSNLSKVHPDINTKIVSKVFVEENKIKNKSNDLEEIQINSKNKNKNVVVVEYKKTEKETSPTHKELTNNAIINKINCSPNATELFPDKALSLENKNFSNNVNLSNTENSSTSKNIDNMLLKKKEGKEIKTTIKHESYNKQSLKSKVSNKLKLSKQTLKEKKFNDEDNLNKNDDIDVNIVELDAKHETEINTNSTSKIKDKSISKVNDTFILQDNSVSQIKNTSLEELGSSSNKTIKLKTFAPSKKFTHTMNKRDEKNKSNSINIQNCTAKDKITVNSNNPPNVKKSCLISKKEINQSLNKNKSILKANLQLEKNSEKSKTSPMLTEKINEIPFFELSSSKEMNSSDIQELNILNENVNIQQSKIYLSPNIKLQNSYITDIFKENSPVKEYKTIEYKDCNSNGLHSCIEEFDEISNNQPIVTKFKDKIKSTSTNREENKDTAIFNEQNDNSIVSLPISKTFENSKMRTAANVYNYVCINFDKEKDKLEFDSIESYETNPIKNKSYITTVYTYNKVFEQNNVLMKHKPKTEQNEKLIDNVTNIKINDNQLNKSPEIVKVKSLQENNLKMTLPENKKEIVETGNSDCNITSEKNEKENNIANKTLEKSFPDNSKKIINKKQEINSNKNHEQSKEIQKCNKIINNPLVKSNETIITPTDQSKLTMSNEKLEVTINSSKPIQSTNENNVSLKKIRKKNITENKLSSKENSICIQKIKDNKDIVHLSKMKSVNKLLHDNVKELGHKSDEAIEKNNENEMKVKPNASFEETDENEKSTFISSNEINQIEIGKQSNKKRITKKGTNQNDAKSLVNNTKKYVTQKSIPPLENTDEKNINQESTKSLENIDEKNTNQHSTKSFENSVEKNINKESPKSLENNEEKNINQKPIKFLEKTDEKTINQVSITSLENINKLDMNEKQNTSEIFTESIENIGKLDNDQESTQILDNKEKNTDKMDSNDKKNNENSSKVLKIVDETITNPESSKSSIINTNEIKINEKSTNLLDKHTENDVCFQNISSETNISRTKNSSQEQLSLINIAKPKCVLSKAESNIDDLVVNVLTEIPNSKTRKESDHSIKAKLKNNESKIIDKDEIQIHQVNDVIIQDIANTTNKINMEKQILTEYDKTLVNNSTEVYNNDLEMFNIDNKINELEKVKSNNPDKYTKITLSETIKSNITMAENSIVKNLDDRLITIEKYSNIAKVKSREKNNEISLENVNDLKISEIQSEKLPNENCDTLDDKPIIMNDYDSKSSKFNQTNSKVICIDNKNTTGDYSNLIMQKNNQKLTTKTEVEIPLEKIDNKTLNTSESTFNVKNEVKLFNIKKDTTKIAHTSLIDKSSNEQSLLVQNTIETETNKNLLEETSIFKADLFQISTNKPNSDDEKVKIKFVNNAIAKSKCITIPCLNDIADENISKNFELNSNEGEDTNEVKINNTMKIERSEICGMNQTDQVDIEGSFTNDKELLALNQIIKDSTTKNGTIKNIPVTHKLKMNCEVIEKINIIKDVPISVKQTIFSEDTTISNTREPLVESLCKTISTKSIDTDVEPKQLLSSSSTNIENNDELCSLNEEETFKDGEIKSPHISTEDNDREDLTTYNDVNNLIGLSDNLLQLPKPKVSSNRNTFLKEKLINSETKTNNSSANIDCDSNNSFSKITQKTCKNINHKTEIDENCLDISSISSDNLLQIPILKLSLRENNINGKEVKSSLTNINKNKKSNDDINDDSKLRKTIDLINLDDLLNSSKIKSVENLKTSNLENSLDENKNENFKLSNKIDLQNEKDDNKKENLFEISLNAIKEKVFRQSATEKNNTLSEEMFEKYLKSDKESIVKNSSKNIKSNVIIENDEEIKLVSDKNLVVQNSKPLDIDKSKLSVEDIPLPPTSGSPLKNSLSEIDKRKQYFRKIFKFEKLKMKKIETEVEKDINEDVPVNDQSLRTKLDNKEYEKINDNSKNKIINTSCKNDYPQISNPNGKKNNESCFVSNEDIKRNEYKSQISKKLYSKNNRECSEFSTKYHSELKKSMSPERKNKCNKYSSDYSTFSRKDKHKYDSEYNRYSKKSLKYINKNNSAKHSSCRYTSDYEIYKSNHHEKSYTRGNSTSEIVHKSGTIREINKIIEKRHTSLPKHSNIDSDIDEVVYHNNEIKKCLIDNIHGPVQYNIKNISIPNHTKKNESELEITHSNSTLDLYNIKDKNKTHFKSRDDTKRNYKDERKMKYKSDHYKKDDKKINTYRKRKSEDKKIIERESSEKETYFIKDIAECTDCSDDQTDLQELIKLNIFEENKYNQKKELSILNNSEDTPNSNFHTSKYQKKLETPKTDLKIQKNQDKLSSPIKNIDIQNNIKKSNITTEYQNNIENKNIHTLSNIKPHHQNELVDKLSEPILKLNEELKPNVNLKKNEIKSFNSALKDVNSNNENIPETSDLKPIDVKEINHHSEKTESLQDISSSSFITKGNNKVINNCNEPIENFNNLDNRSEINNINILENKNIESDFVCIEANTNCKKIVINKSEIKDIHNNKTENDMLILTDVKLNSISNNPNEAYDNVLNDNLNLSKHSEDFTNVPSSDELSNTNITQVEKDLNNSSKRINWTTNSKCLTQYSETKTKITKNICRIQKVEVQISKTDNQQVEHSDTHEMLFDNEVNIARTSIHESNEVKEKKTINMSESCSAVKEFKTSYENLIGNNKEIFIEKSLEKWNNNEKENPVKSKKMTEKEIKSNDLIQTSEICDNNEIKIQNTPIIESEINLIGTKYDNELILTINKTEIIPVATINNEETINSTKEKNNKNQRILNCTASDIIIQKPIEQSENNKCPPKTIDLTYKNKDLNSNARVIEPEASIMKQYKKDKSEDNDEIINSTTIPISTVETENKVLDSQNYHSKNKIKDKYNLTELEKPLKETEIKDGSYVKLNHMKIETPNLPCVVNVKANTKSKNTRADKNVNEPTDITKDLSNDILFKKVDIEVNSKTKTEAIKKLVEPLIKNLEIKTSLDTIIDINAKTLNQESLSDGTDIIFNPCKAKENMEISLVLTEETLCKSNEKTTDQVVENQAESAIQVTSFKSTSESISLEERTENVFKSCQDEDNANMLTRTKIKESTIDSQKRSVENIDMSSNEKLTKNNNVSTLNEASEIIDSTAKSYKNHFYENETAETTSKPCTIEDNVEDLMKVKDSDTNIDLNKPTKETLTDIVNTKVILEENVNLAKPINSQIENIKDPVNQDLIENNQTQCNSKPKLSKYKDFVAAKKTNKTSKHSMSKADADIILNQTEFCYGLRERKVKVCATEVKENNNRRSSLRKQANLKRKLDNVQGKSIIEKKSKVSNTKVEETNFENKMEKSENSQEDFADNEKTKTDISESIHKNKNTILVRDNYSQILKIPNNLNSSKTNNKAIKLNDVTSVNVNSSFESITPNFTSENNDNINDLKNLSKNKTEIPPSLTPFWTENKTNVLSLKAIPVLSPELSAKPEETPGCSIKLKNTKYKRKSRRKRKKSGFKIMNKYKKFNGDKSIDESKLKRVTNKKENTIVSYTKIPIEIITESNNKIKDIVNTKASQIIHTNEVQNIPVSKHKDTFIDYNETKENGISEEHRIKKLSLNPEIFNTSEKYSSLCFQNKDERKFRTRNIKREHLKSFDEDENLNKIIKIDEPITKDINVQKIEYQNKIIDKSNEKIDLKDDSISNNVESKELITKAKRKCFGGTNVFPLKKLKASSDLLNSNIKTQMELQKSEILLDSTLVCPEKIQTEKIFMKNIELKRKINQEKSIINSNEKKIVDKKNLKTNNSKLKFKLNAFDANLSLFKAEKDNDLKSIKRVSIKPTPTLDKIIKDILIKNNTMSHTVPDNSNSKKKQQGLIKSEKNKNNIQQDKSLDIKVNHNFKRDNTCIDNPDVIEKVNKISKQISKLKEKKITQVTIFSERLKKLSERNIEKQIQEEEEIEYHYDIGNFHEPVQIVSNEQNVTPKNDCLFNTQIKANTIFSDSRESENNASQHHDHEDIEKSSYINTTDLCNAIANSNSLENPYILSNNKDFILQNKTFTEHNQNETDIINPFTILMKEITNELENAKKYKQKMFLFNNTDFSFNENKFESSLYKSFTRTCLDNLNQRDYENVTNISNRIKQTYNNELLQFNLSEISEFIFHINKENNIDFSFQNISEDIYQHSLYNIHRHKHISDTSDIDTLYEIIDNIYIQNKSNQQIKTKTYQCIYSQRKNTNIYIEYLRSKFWNYLSNNNQFKLKPNVQTFNDNLEETFLYRIDLQNNYYKNFDFQNYNLLKLHESILNPLQSLNNFEYNFNSNLPLVSKYNLRNIFFEINFIKSTSNVLTYEKNGTQDNVFSNIKHNVNEKDINTDSLLVQSNESISNSENKCINSQHISSNSEFIPLNQDLDMLSNSILNRTSNKDETYKDTSSNNLDQKTETSSQKLYFSEYREPFNTISMLYENSISPTVEDFLQHINKSNNMKFKNICTYDDNFDNGISQNLNCKLSNKFKLLHINEYKSQTFSQILESSNNALNLLNDKNNEKIALNENTNNENDQTNNDNTNMLQNTGYKENFDIRYTHEEVIKPNNENSNTFQVTISKETCNHPQKLTDKEVEKFNDRNINEAENFTQIYADKKIENISIIENEHNQSLVNTVDNQLIGNIERNKINSLHQLKSSDNIETNDILINTIESNNNIIYYEQIENTNVEESQINIGWIETSDDEKEMKSGNETPLQDEIYFHINIPDENETQNIIHHNENENESLQILKTYTDEPIHYEIDEDFNVQMGTDQNEHDRFDEIIVDPPISSNNEYIDTVTMSSSCTTHVPIYSETKQIDMLYKNNNSPQLINDLPIDTNDTLCNSSKENKQVSSTIILSRTSDSPYLETEETSIKTPQHIVEDMLTSSIIDWPYLEEEVITQDENIIKFDNDLKVQLPWSKIFNIDNKPVNFIDDTTHEDKTSLELGPVEVKLQLDSYNTTSCLKVKRLILKKSTQENKNTNINQIDSEFNENQSNSDLNLNNTSSTDNSNVGFIRLGQDEIDITLIQPQVDLEKVDIIEDMLESKLNSINLQDIVTCDFCDRELLNQDRLQCHIRDLHELFTCSACNQSFSGYLLYSVHKSSHLELHHCLLCQKTFSKIDKFRLHQQTFSHQQLENIQRQTIHVLYKYFTGTECPNLESLSNLEISKLNWRPYQAGIIHNYYPTPLEHFLQAHKTAHSISIEKIQSTNLNNKNLTEYNEHEKNQNDNLENSDNHIDNTNNYDTIEEHGDTNIQLFEQNNEIEDNINSNENSSNENAPDSFY